MIFSYYVVSKEIYTRIDRELSWRENCKCRPVESQHSHLMSLFSVGWDRGLGYAPYGERFREFRRMFHQTMGPRALHELFPLQEEETPRLLLRLLEEPEKFIEHARQYVHLSSGFISE